MKTLAVMTCRQCPFFRETPLLGALLTYLSPPNTVRSGWCSYDRAANRVVVLQLGLPPGPERDKFLADNKVRMIIENRDEIPPECPLRIEPVTVSLVS